MAAAGETDGHPIVFLVLGATPYVVYTRVEAEKTGKGYMQLGYRPAPPLPPPPLTQTTSITPTVTFSNVVKIIQTLRYGTGMLTCVSTPSGAASLRDPTTNAWVDQVGVNKFLASRGFVFGMALPAAYLKQVATAGGEVTAAQDRPLSSKSQLERYAAHRPSLERIRATAGQISGLADKSIDQIVALISALVSPPPEVLGQPDGEPHDSISYGMSALSELPLTVLAREIVVGRSKFAVKFNNVLTILTGKIDILLWDPFEQCLVVADIKCHINPRSGGPDTLALGQQNVRQLHVYGKLLENDLKFSTGVANLADLPVHVGYYLLISYRIPSATFTRWRIPRDDNLFNIVDN